ncbi:MAG TPA: helix-hairpin-helix domain-containing protein [Puia sp.]|nr:helix-hairpin-helix domain-containing protein [Puia sp.]
MNEPSLNIAEMLDSEKRKLRANGIKLKEIHHHSIRELRSMLDVSEIRAMELKAMSEFQSIPSIGKRFAENLLQLGFYSLKEIRGKDPAKLLDKLELYIGAWIDPCVEDQFRLVVHYADHPDSVRNWWDFTSERKVFRQKKGYPANRPEKPWFDLEQFKTVNRIKASAGPTKVDLHKKLKLALKYMQENMEGEVTLAKLSDTAHLSPFHFLRLFKATYELTPMQYLTRLRMKKACRLLKTTNRSVGWISDSCGFESQSSFIRLFKKEFGTTPQVFRKKHLYPN